MSMSARCYLRGTELDMVQQGVNRTLQFNRMPASPGCGKADLAIPEPYISNNDISATRTPRSSGAGV